MVKDLRQQGFKLITITDLHIAKLPGYKPYDQGMAHDYFVKNPDGSVYVGRCGGRQRLSGFHAIGRPRLVGIALHRFREGRDSRLLERYE